MNLDRSTLSHRVHLFVGLALDVDSVGGDAEEVGDVRTHRFLVRSEFGPLEDDGGIEIHHRPAAHAKPAGGFEHEQARVLRFVAGIGVGKELPDVRMGQGAEDRIGDGVVEGITIGMADRAEIVWYRDATKNERPSVARGRQAFQSMQVVSVSNAEGIGRYSGHALG